MSTVHYIQHTESSESKRRKLGEPIPQILGQFEYSIHTKCYDYARFNNLTNANDTQHSSVPISAAPSNEIEMKNPDECPCGHLHGPGQGDHDDVHAVGLSSAPLLRGPD